MEESTIEDLIGMRIPACTINSRYTCTFNISSPDKWMDWEVEPNAKSTKFMRAGLKAVDLVTGKASHGELRLSEHSDLTTSAKHSLMLYLTETPHGKITSMHTVCSIALDKENA